MKTTHDILLKAIEQMEKSINKKLSKLNDRCDHYESSEMYNYKTEEMQNDVDQFQKIMDSIIIESNKLQELIDESNLRSLLFLSCHIKQK